MQLTFEKRDISSNFEGKELGFQIDTSGPWIFELLRSKFYADPVGSICREICDNARDAHREVGKRDRPIEIWLPGDYLVIKDFGPGLSPERVEEIYRFYGKSTKRGDNTQGGGFGIGAKTPFAHTDQFFIETVIDQMKYVWLNYLDETNVGKLKLVSQQETLEENGTAIKIPIKSHYKHDFINKILWYTKYWYLTGDAQPKYHGTVTDPINKHVMESPTNKWVIFDKYQDVDVIVNGIPYKTNIINVPECCVLIFEVGELDLAANRETLQETSKTKQALLDRHKVLYNEIHQIIQKDASNLEIQQLLSLINKFDVKQTQWEYRGVKFDYPLKGDYLEVSLGHSYLHHRTYCKNINNHIICEYDETDWYKLSSYTKQKIRQVIRENGKKCVFIIKKDEKNPIFTFFPKIDLDKVKLVRSKSSNISKRTKKTCLIWDIKTKQCLEVPFNNQADERIYLTVNSLRINQRSVSTDYYMKYVPNTCVITIGSEKKIKGNWISWEKYLEREIWGKYSEQELQDIVNERDWNTKHKEYLFLKHIDPQFNWKTKYDKIPEWVLSKILTRYTATAQNFDFSKYPLLELIDCKYLSDNNKKLVINYVKEQLCKCNI